MSLSTTYRHRPGALLLGLILFALAARAQAQQPVPPLDPSTAGKTFVLAYPDTTTNIVDSRFPNNRVTEGFTLYLYSAVGPNKVRIAKPGGNVSIVTLEAGKFLAYEVKANQVVSVINNVQFNTIRLDAEQPIIVYSYFAVRQSSEAWTPIPVEMWGKRYNVASTPPSVVNDIGIAGETAIPFSARKAPAEALIIAAYDNTHVTINANGRVLEGNTNNTITLNANKAYQIQSWVDTNLTATIQPDLAGMSIEADRPIGVLSGNTRALVRQEEGGLANNVYKNMLMEWLVPADQQGTRFLFMPTWDGRRDDTTNKTSTRREEEIVRVIGNSQGRTNGSYISAAMPNPLPFSAPKDSLAELVLGTRWAVYIKTTSPAQVMMMSNCITKFEGSTPCFQGLPCLSYSGWAPYMAELTPREQWTSFAPFIAPTYPTNSEHYINVVTDTASAKTIRLDDGSPFPFTRRVPETDLVWGSMSLTPGVTRFLVGTEGARFGGFVYGLYRGSEDYRPGKPRKDGEKDEILGEATALHPCEYEEYSALSYGYPIAPRRNVIVSSGDLKFDTLTECTHFILSIRSLGIAPAGIRSVELDSAASVNAKLVAVDPVKIDDINGRSTADLLVLPVDPLADAKGFVVVIDRGGRIWRIPFRFSPSSGLSFDRSSLDFGLVGYRTAYDTTIAITNTSGHPVVIRGIRHAIPSGPFEIVSTQPALNPTATLPPGGTLLVRVRLKSQQLGGIFIDSLQVQADCDPFGILMRAEVAAPEINVSNPTFGVGGVVNESKPALGSFDICNTGRLPIILHNPNGGRVIEWSDSAFSIPDSVLAGLEGMTLGPGDCVTIKVAFRPSKPGTYRTVARVWASTRSIRDTSIWRVVVPVSMGAPDPPAVGYSYDGAAPNPFNARTRVRFTLGSSGQTTVAIYNEAGKKIATIADRWLDAGPHEIEWDASGMPGGRYFCRITSGRWQGGDDRSNSNAIGIILRK